MRTVSALLFVVAALGACGPSVNGDGGPDAYTGTTGILNGRVWAPGQAPGQVPAGHEIPIFGALVWVTATRPDPIPQQVYCEPCLEAPAGGVLSDHQGNFSLSNITPGDYWLVIQKGQFRLEQQISVERGPRELSPAETTMPGVHNPDAGSWVPRIAMAVGDYDSLEDILGKMGMGQVDSLGSYVERGGQIDIFGNGGDEIGQSVGRLADLVSSLDRMRQYHIIFIPCAGDSNTSALSNQQVLKNIRDYVKEGGKLYVTDWSGEWMDNVFPQQIQLGGLGSILGLPGVDTPDSAYNASADTWNTSQFGSADGNLYNSPDGEAADANLHAWFDGQFGPDAEFFTESPINASHFEVVDNWNYIERMQSIQTGVDEEGLPIYDEPYAWVIGTNPDVGGGKRPLTVTFEPTGCGRVLFSTYHTTPNNHLGLIPQERVLLYLIMEIGVCKEGPIVD